MIRPAAVALSICCALLTGDAADAQMCFEGRPAPECKSFWVTEIGLGMRISDDRAEDKAWPISEIGLMYNLKEQYAIGATSYVAFESHFSEFRGGAKLRVRRWFNPDLSLNVSGGLVLFGSAHGEEFPAFTGHLDFNYREVLVPYVAVDVLRDERSALDGANWQAGLRFGSYPGAGLTGFAIGVIAVGVYLFATAG